MFMLILLKMVRFLEICYAIDFGFKICFTGKICIYSNRKMNEL